MITRTCDRCGREIIGDELSSKNYRLVDLLCSPGSAYVPIPSFEFDDDIKDISISYVEKGTLKQVDLCSSCLTGLEDYIFETVGLDYGRHAKSEARNQNNDDNENTERSESNE